MPTTPTTLDELIAHRANRPRFQEVVFLDHRCDYGHCESPAVRIAVTAHLNDHGVATGANEVRGVCERHFPFVPTTV